MLPYTGHTKESAVSWQLAGLHPRDVGTCLNKQPRLVTPTVQILSIFLIATFPLIQHRNISLTRHPVGEAACPVLSLIIALSPSTLVYTTLSSSVASSVSPRPATKHPPSCMSREDLDQRDPYFDRLRQRPRWYHQFQSPFFNPTPAARMEKSIAELARAEWHWKDHQEKDLQPRADYLETCLCPCGVYSQTWTRLREVWAGRSPRDIPDAGLMNSDCCAYATCLPCKCTWKELPDPG